MKTSCVLSLFICIAMVVLSVQDLVAFHTLNGDWVNYVVREDNIFSQNVGNLLNDLWVFITRNWIIYRKKITTKITTLDFYNHSYAYFQT